jgi:thymidylate synthase
MGHPFHENSKRNLNTVSCSIIKNCSCVFGYTGDVHWALHVQMMLANDLDVEIGDLIWTASNLHAYERHFSHIEELMNDQTNTSN